MSDLVPPRVRKRRYTPWWIWGLLAALSVVAIVAGTYWFYRQSAPSTTAEAPPPQPGFVTEPQRSSEPSQLLLDYEASKVAPRSLSGEPPEPDRVGARLQPIKPDPEEMANRPWRLLSRFQFGDPRWRHWGAAGSLAVSLDGKYAVSVGQDCRIVVWELHTGKEVCCLIEGRSNTYALSGRVDVEFSQDGSKLYVLAKDTVRLYAWPSLQQLARLDSKLSPLYIDCNFDGSLVLIGFFYSSELRGYEGGELVKIAELDAEASLDPTGTTVVTDPSRKVSVIDVNSGKTRWTRAEVGHLLRFSLDDRLAVVNGGDVAVLNAANGEVESSISVHTKHGLADTSLGPFTSDLCMLMARAENAVIAWDFQQDRKIFELPVRRPSRAVISADDRVLVASTTLGEIRAWDLSTRQPIPPADPERDFYIRSVRFAADGRTLLLLGNNGEVRQVDVSTGAELSRVQSQEPGRPVPDRSGTRFLAPSNKGVAIYDVATGHIQQDYELTKPIDSYHWNVDASQIACHHDGQLTAIDTTTGKVRRIDRIETLGWGDYEFATKVHGFTADGNSVLVGWWTFDLQEKTRVPPDKWSGAFAYLSGDGEQVYTCKPSEGAVNSYIAIRAAKTGVEIASRFTGVEWSILQEQDELISVYATPDDRWVAAGTDLGCVYVWDMAKGTTAFKTPTAYTVGPLYGRIRDVALSPDGKFLATANGNGTARLFKLPP